MKKSGFAISVSALFSICVLSACTTQNGEKPNLALQDASSAVATSARLGTMATPLSYGYLIDKQMPVPTLKELSFNETPVSPAVEKLLRETALTTGPVSLRQSTPEVDHLISKYSVAYNVPERLVRRVVKRESEGNPSLRNGPYLGLMQISHPTAKGMGYAGEPKGLLDAETNLRYAVKYLAGAYKVAAGDESQAVRLYARGYYYDAKAKGMLQESGLRNGPNSPETAYDALENAAPQTGRTGYNRASSGNGTVTVPSTTFTKGGA